VYNDGFKKEGLAFIDKIHADELSNVIIQSGDILLNITGDSVARVCQVPEEIIPARVNQHVAIIRPNKEDLDARYLRYFLVSPQMQQKMLAFAAAGATRNALTKGMIESFDVPAPPLPQQRAIARILGSLDDKIELNRRMNETLESIARTIFKSWFVDFDPVRAKSEGREPVGMDAETAALFPDSFEETELGMVPKGWCVGTIEDLAEVFSGKRPDVRYSNASSVASVPLWGGNGPMGFVPTPLISYPILLTGRVGTLGSVFRIVTPCWPSDNTLILRARDEQDIEYLFLQLRQIDFYSLNRGSTQPLLTQTDLKSQSLVLPSKSIIARFNFVEKWLFEKIDAVNNESIILAEIRDALLPRLISGGIRVTDKEILLSSQPNNKT
jgi:type I restriction enzyme S subunit